MDEDTFARVIVQHLKANLSEKQAKQIYTRNTRFLPSQLLDDYQSIVLLEATEIPKDRFDARCLEAICNRVAKRLIYAAKKQNERFTQLRDSAADSSSQEAQRHIEEISRMLSIEEQIYLSMKMEGYTLREIAENLGIPISTVHHRWTQIVSKIKALSD